MKHATLYALLLTLSSTVTFAAAAGCPHSQLSLDELSLPDADLAGLYAELARPECVNRILPNTLNITIGPDEDDRKLVFEGIVTELVNQVDVNGKKMLTHLPPATIGGLSDETCALIMDSDSLVWEQAVLGLTSEQKKVVPYNCLLNEDILAVMAARDTFHQYENLAGYAWEMLETEDPLNDDEKEVLGLVLGYTTKKVVESIYGDASKNTCAKITKDAFTVLGEGLDDGLPVHPLKGINHQCLKAIPAGHWQDLHVRVRNLPDDAFKGAFAQPLATTCTKE